MPCEHCRSGRSIVVDGALHVQDSTLTADVELRRCRHCKGMYFALPAAAYDELVGDLPPAVKVEIGPAAFGPGVMVPAYDGEIRVANGLESFNYDQTWPNASAAAAAVVGRFFPGLVPEAWEADETEDGRPLEEHGVAWNLPDNEWASVGVEVLEVRRGMWIVTKVWVYTQTRDADDEGLAWWE
jgi:hypothetical protein